MNQRTCNIIMCCKGHCELPGGKGEARLTQVAAYMSHECACPMEDYKGILLESIMQEAMFDYIEGADKPGQELRRLFCGTYLNPEPSMSERIASMFSLCQIKESSGYVNGFTEKLLAQSCKDLGEDKEDTSSV